MSELKSHIQNFLKGNIPLIDVWYYIQGTIRCKLYYSKFKFLIRKHIQEQIAFRMLTMDRGCLENGECKICGCSTPALQMCDKVCEGDCYPPMMSYKIWEVFQKGTCIDFDGWYWKLEDNNLYSGKKEHLLIHKTIIRDGNHI